MASRSMDSRGAPAREHETKKQQTSIAVLLQNTRLQRQQFLEFRQVPEFRKLRILLEPLLVLESFFDALAHILERPIVVPRFGVGLRQVVMKLSAFLDAAFLQQDTRRTAVFKDV